MKQTFLLFASVFTIFTNHAVAASVSGTYRMQLYFGDSTPFVDDMTVERSEAGLKGSMHVPNDFDGPLLNISENGNEFEFDLLVPKNASRPEMIFHYKAIVLLPEADNIAGFVTLTKSDGVEVKAPSYIGSFVAFRKK